MNRLIIIGNGFDLAHGINSRFKDLIINYLFTVWGKLSTGTYSDRLIEIKRAKKYFTDKDSALTNKNILKLFKAIYKSSSDGADDAYMIIKSNFFKVIFNKILFVNWADIETEYFNELYSIVETVNKKKQQEVSYDRTSIEERKINSIKKLNADLDYLEEILVSYLNSEMERFNKDRHLDDAFIDFFEESITFYNENGGVKRMESVADKYILNFNYTNTLDNYNTSSFKKNYIHGTLTDNPIFGFGDDTSSKYIELENENDNEFLGKIKSFKYLDNDKYRKLINFINSGAFQVQIFGHSCGVSDRTILKQIFENINCENIEIFYHDRNDFDEKKYEISRHFNNKVLFLDKVQSFTKLRKMPQPKEKKKTDR